MTTQNPGHAFATLEDIAGATFWTFNLPLELRPKLEACLPEARFYFITVKNPISNSTKRILEAARSSILLFGDTEPPGLADFLERTGLHAFRLWTSFLQLRGAGHVASGAVGFVLGRGGTPTQPDREAWLRAAPPVPFDAGALRDLYRRLGLSEANFPNAPPAAPLPGKVPGGRRRYLIVPDAPRVGSTEETRQDSVRDLLAQAHASRPDGAFTLLARTEPGQAAGVPPLAGMPSLPGPYSPILLEGFDGVVTATHFAGFDALLRGLDVVCLGQPAWRLAMAAQGEAAAASLDAVFAAYFLVGTYYLPPHAPARTTPEEAFRAVAATLPGSTARPVSEPRRPVAREAQPDPAPKPMERAETIIQPPPPLALPTPPGDPVLGDRYRLPEWAATRRLMIRCPGRARAEGEILALAHDLDRSPLTAALVDTAGPFPVLPTPAGPPSPAELAALAEERPEVLHRLLVAELAQLPLGARIALVVGTDDPAVRAFARACATFGMLRLHLPAAPWSTTGHAAAATHRRTTGLLALADLVGAWHPSHHHHAAEIGYPAARLAHVSTFPPADNQAGLLVCIHDAARDATAMLLACRDAAIRRGCGLVVHIAAEAVARLGQTFFTALLAEEAVRLEWADAPTQPLHRMMAAAAVIVSDTMPLHDMARATGRPALAILPTPLGKDTWPPGAEAELAAGLAALPPPTKAAPQDDLALLVRFAIARALPLGVVPGAAERILQRQDLPIAVLCTSLSPEELQRAQRHVPAMLGVREHVQVQGGMARLAAYRDADLFAIWGTRHPPASRELRGAARMLGRDVLILEDGFIRSVNIGLSGEPGLSLILDDRAAYFDATRPSRLESLLNDAPSPDAATLARSQALIERIVAQKISKYNASPYVRAQVGDPARPKILLLDQRRGDQSLALGLADDESFARMVDAALGLARTHDILVKLHPDVTVGGREGCLGPALMDRLAKAPGAYLIEQDVSPHALIDLSEKVFTVTSGAGFEALMAGREVWCFGMPYYAGRGLTRDAVRPLRPRRARSVAELFHAAWITLSRYYSPTLGRACELEELIDHIVAVRPWALSEGPAMALGRRLTLA